MSIKSGQGQVMALVSRRISTGKLVKNLVVVFLANFVGATGLSWLVSLSGHSNMNGGALGNTAIAIATAKCALSFVEAFIKGVLCNLLVCLAVWIALAGRTVTDKILAIVFPISAFVAAGFEHSVANMHFIPLGLFLSDPTSVSALNWSGFVQNIIPVTLGNLVGGAVMVGLVYWVIYRRASSPGTKAAGPG